MILRRLRFSLANVLLMMTCFALAIGWWSTVKPPEVHRKSYQPLNSHVEVLPLTISASEEDGWGHAWFLSVNSAGDAELTVAHVGELLPQQFRLSQQQMKELKTLLIQEEFFSLGDEHGEEVIDGNIKTLTISSGSLTKTICIQAEVELLLVTNDTQKLRELARALRVWKLVRSWINDPKALDSTTEVQRPLDSVAAQLKSHD